MMAGMNSRPDFSRCSRSSADFPEHISELRVRLGRPAAALQNESPSAARVRGGGGCRVAGRRTCTGGVRREPAPLLLRREELLCIPGSARRPRDQRRQRVKTAAWRTAAAALAQPRSAEGRAPVNRSRKVEGFMSENAQPILFFFCRPCGDYHEKTHPHYAEMTRRAEERKAASGRPDPKREARARAARDHLMIALARDRGGSRRITRVSLQDERWGPIHETRVKPISTVRTDRSRDPRPDGWPESCARFRPAGGIRVHGWFDCTGGQAADLAALPISAFGLAGLLPPFHGNLGSLQDSSQPPGCGICRPPAGPPGAGLPAILRTRT
jgi:hypothetical protein